MLCLRACGVSACCQFARPCCSGNRVSVVPCPNSTGMSSLRPWRDVPRRAVLLEELDHVLARAATVGPLAGDRALDQRLVDVVGERVGRQRGGAQRERPLGADHAVGGDALREVVPGDLGGDRVEDRLAADPQRLERAEELVAAAVAAADRAEPRVAGAVLLHPAEVADQPDQAADVVALEVGVLDVREAAGGAPAALVEGEHAVPGVEELADAARVRWCASRPSRGCASASAPGASSVARAGRNSV